MHSTTPRIMFATIGLIVGGTLPGCGDPFAEEEARPTDAPSLEQNGGDLGNDGRLLCRDLDVPIRDADGVDGEIVAQVDLCYQGNPSAIWDRETDIVGLVIKTRPQWLPKDVFATQVPGGYTATLRLVGESDLWCFALGDCETAYQAYSVPLGTGQTCASAVPAWPTQDIDCTDPGAPTED